MARNPTWFSSDRSQKRARNEVQGKNATRAISQKEIDEKRLQQLEASKKLLEKKNAAQEFKIGESVTTADNKHGVVRSIDTKRWDILVKFSSGRILKYLPSALTKE